MVTRVESDTKTWIPVNSSDLVRRRALLRRLSSTSGQPLLVVTAPPGYGKTAALAQWVREDDRDATWVTVDDADNDAGTLLRHIGAGLASPGHPREVQDGEDGNPRLMVEDLHGRDTPVIIVLDDAHRLHRPPVLDLVVRLATRLPFGSQVVLSGRMTPPLRLDRLLRDRHYAEFGPADLAFKAEEVAAVLARTGVEAGREDVRSLFEHTEGWPAGVYLTALALKEQVDPPIAPGEVSGGHTYIADYFRDEVLAWESPQTVEFLLRSAVLDRLSGALCDAVLETTGSAATLAELDRRNVFVMPIDDQCGWYRYHYLFREALARELRRRQPGEEQRLHLRAAAWYHSEGMIEKAVEHWIAGGDRLAANRLINRHGADFIGAGRIAVVRGWIEGLGPEAVLAHPATAMTAAWVWALSGETERAEQLLLTAQQAAPAGPAQDGSSLAADICLLRAAMGRQGVDRMLADAQRAVALEPPDGPGYALAVTVLGIAYLLTGSTNEAVQQLEHVAVLGRKQPRTEAVLALAEMALLDADLRDWPSAHRHAQEAHVMMSALDSHDGPACALTLLARARVDLHERQPSSARRALGAAVRRYLDLPTTGFPWLAAQAALVLGELALELDDVAAAQTRVQDTRRHLARLPTEGVLRDRLRKLSAGIARVGGQRTVPSPMALSAAEQRVLRLLPTHLSLGEIGDRLHITRNTVKGHVAAVYRKLQASNRAEVVVRARELGLLS